MNCCANKRAEVDTKGSRLPSIVSTGSDSVFALRSELLELVSKIEAKQEELSQLHARKDEALVLHQQYQHVIEAQEAELQRIRDTMPGGALTRFWEDKLAHEARVSAEVEGEKKTVEADVIALQREVDALAGSVNEQAKLVEELRKELDDGEEEKGEGHARRDSPAKFFERVAAMKSGELITAEGSSLKPQTVFLSLAPACDVLRLSASSKKKDKPFETIALQDISSFSFPAKGATANKKAKAAAAADPSKTPLRFSVDTAAGTAFVFTCTSFAQLLTWALGLQNLSAKPGQSLLAAGEVLWQHTRAKLKCEADQRGISKQKMVAEALMQMLPAEEEEVLESARGGAVEDQGGAIPEGDEDE